MYDGPHNSIEEQLKAWAQSRRDEAGGPFELDEVNRRQLQEEVARTQAPTLAPARMSVPFWRLLFPRLAAGVALTTLLFVAVLQFGSRQGPIREIALVDTKAGHDSPVTTETESMPLPAAGVSAAPQPESASPDLAVGSSPALARPEPRPAPVRAKPKDLRSDAPSESDRLLEMDSRVPADATVDVQFQKTSRTSDDAAERPTDQASLARERVEPRGAVRSRYGLSAPAAPTTSSAKSDLAEVAKPKLRDTEAAGAPEPALAVSPNKERPLVAQDFPAPAAPAASTRTEADAAVESFTTAGAYAQVERYRRNFQSPPQVVLARFTIEEHGRQIRLLDQDGSVYNGELMPGINREPSPQTTTPVGRLTTAKSQATEPAGLAFEVRGTNRTTRQAVVFRGTWIRGRESKVVGQATLDNRSRLTIDAAATGEANR